MIVTYTLLALSICAVWLPSVRLAGRFNLPPWLALFGCAVASGLITGHLQPLAIVSLGVFLLLAYLATRPYASRAPRMVFGTLTALVALALAIHRLPGFNNPVLITAVQFSTDAAPFTLRANFDKGAVGLLLLALFCRRAGSRAEWAGMLRKTTPIAICTIVGVLSVASGIGFVRPEFKLPAELWIFLSVNLFFTVVAEEALFRGFLQARLAGALASVKFGSAIAVSVSALLFGLAHFGGGLAYVGLATLAGLGYAIAYARTQRIESAILMHFLLNAVHFVGFTFPFIKPSL
ncbi:MAG: CPBP family intramembrane glutamic endopeptidase [Pseudomonadota bacterium]